MFLKSFPGTIVLINTSSYVLCVNVYTSKTYDHLHEALRHHYAYETEKSYVRWIKEFIRFHNMAAPRHLGAEAVEAFLTHRAVHKQVAASTQNQAFSALIFALPRSLSSRYKLESRRLVGKNDSLCAHCSVS